MSFLAWMAALGALLLTISLVSGWVRHLPITTYAIYMAVGFVAGPLVLGLVSIDFPDDAYWLERLTEISLIVSLFIGGLKMRIPFTSALWRPAGRLASIAMVLTVAGLTVPLHLFLGLSWPLALMLSAMLAPTDPVLASQVAVNDATDRDDLHVALSGEAGFNDGTALPFLLLGLATLHAGFGAATVSHWFLLHVLWAVPGAVAIGYAMGWIAGHAIVRLRTTTRAGAPGDLLMLALMLLTYAAAQGAQTLGYVAVFAAGLGLRRTEMAIVTREGQAGSDRSVPATPAEWRTEAWRGEDEPTPLGAVGKMVHGALSFGSTLERLLGTLLMLLLGVLIAQNWDWRGLVVAAWLFVLVRPAAVWIATFGLHLPWERRLMMGWLGIRGIGSLNYLAYALTHGYGGQQHAQLVSAIVVTAVAASVAVHGTTTSPLLDQRRRALSRHRNDGDEGAT
ncbi:MAG TPA: cation:proton antiporter [Rhodanobacteraceae bacterium]|nr:cation:proton antiporter [Rhodanobacteraceae bacterium]